MTAPRKKYLNKTEWERTAAKAVSLVMEGWSVEETVELLNKEGYRRASGDEHTMGSVSTIFWHWRFDKKRHLPDNIRLRPGRPQLLHARKMKTYKRKPRKPVSTAQESASGRSQGLVVLGALAFAALTYWAIVGRFAH